MWERCAECIVDRRKENQMYLATFDTEEALNAFFADVTRLKRLILPEESETAETIVVQVEDARETWCVCQRKLTYSSQNHCTSSQAFISVGDCTPTEKDLLLLTLAEWESSRLKINKKMKSPAHIGISNKTLRWAARFFFGALV